MTATCNWTTVHWPIVEHYVSRSKAICKVNSKERQRWLTATVISIQIWLVFPGCKRCARQHSAHDLDTSKGIAIERTFISDLSSACHINSPFLSYIVQHALKMLMSLISNLLRYVRKPPGVERPGTYVRSSVHISHFYYHVILHSRLFLTDLFLNRTWKGSVCTGRLLAPSSPFSTPPNG